MSIIWNLYYDSLLPRTVGPITKSFFLASQKKLIKRAEKSSAGPQPIVHLLLISNRLAVQLTMRLTLKDRYRIKDLITNDLVNLLGLSITNDPSTSMRLPNAAHLKCGVIACDRWAKKEIAAKSNRKIKRKERDERRRRWEKREIEEWIFFIKFVNIRYRAKSKTYKITVSLTRNVCHHSHWSL